MNSWAAKALDQPSDGLVSTRNCNKGVSIPEFDVFVLFDDRDGITRSTILPELSINYITYSTIDNESIPGKPVFYNLEMLLDNSNTALIVVSRPFRENKQIKLLASCVVQYNAETNRKTITLIVEGNLKGKGLIYLRSTNLLYMSSPSWQNELITEIKVKIPDFCEVVSTGKFTDALTVMGLSSSNTTYDIGNVYGLALNVNEKLLTVYLEEYSQHVKLHHHFNTASFCGQCNMLCDINTKVRVVFDAKFTSDKFQVPEVLVSLFLNVFDIETSVKKNMNQLVSGVIKNSSIGTNQLPYLSLLFGKVRRAIMNKWISLSSQPIFPNYKDQKKRLESFIKYQDTLNSSVESFVAAGFFYNEDTELVECFSCSIATVHFRGKGSPFKLHLEAAPDCEYINSISPPENTEVILTDLSSDSNQIVEEFRDIEQRKRSYESFDMSNVTTTGGYLDKEVIIDKLCEAGFYYSGRLTLINCFCCRIAIFFNKDDVDPWVLHASLSPLCAYVLEKKGAGFIKDVSSVRSVGHDEDAEHFVITFSLKSLDSHDPYRTKGYNFTLYHI